MSPTIRVANSETDYSRNAPMLAINRMLGYRPLAGHLSLVRTF